MRKIDRKKIARKRLAQKRLVQNRREKRNKEKRAILMRQFIKEAHDNPSDPLFPLGFFSYDQEQFLADLDRQQREYRNLINRKF